jgi:hypothetical protein
MTNEETSTVESRLLQWLCQGEGDGKSRKGIFLVLQDYRFRRVEHQVLFDCLQAMPLDRPELIRELLPARLVRAGFPDFELAPFCKWGEPGEVSEEDARDLCRELMESRRAEPEQTPRRSASLG